jgi:hypothetical protein
MKPYAEDALVFALSLEAGLVSVPDVIEWAKSLIDGMDEYDDDVMDLFLSDQEPPVEVLSRLRRLADDADEWQAMRRMLGRMHEVLRQTPNQARGLARFLYSFWIRHNCSVPVDMDFMAGIDDSFELAELGIAGSVDEATAALIESLSVFK